MLCCGYEFRHFTNNQFEYIPLKWIISVSSWNDHNWLLPLIASLFLFTFSLVSPFISSLSPSTTNNNKKGRRRTQSCVQRYIPSLWHLSSIHSMSNGGRCMKNGNDDNMPQTLSEGIATHCESKWANKQTKKKRNTFGVIVLILGCHPSSWYWIIHAAKEQEKDRSTCHIQSKLVQMCKGVW